MLHKLEIPAYRVQIEAILNFQEHLLSFACTAPSLPVDKSAFVKEFGAQQGKWLSERCWWGRTKTRFYKELEALISYVAGNPLEGPAIVDAFRNDRNFYKCLDDPNFEFHYPRLSSGTKEKVKPPMVSFYELLSTGFPEYIHLCQNAETFTTKALLKGFYEANPLLKVCPGCDGEPPYISNKTLNPNSIDDSDDYRDEMEIDHFFPKAFYPFLSIHFMNLVPLCSNCNQKAKHNVDPLNKRTGKDILQYTFLPFSKPAAQCIDVMVSRNAQNSAKVAIRNRPGQATKEEVENLNRTFKLRLRWEHRLTFWLDDTMLQFRASSARRKGDRRKVEKAIKSKLRPLAKHPEENIGQMTHYFAQKAYAQYALGDPLEITLLVDQIMDENAPKKRVF